VSVVEFIGFVITFATMMILFGKKAKEEKRRKMDPEGYERDQRAKKEALDKLYSVILDGQSKPNRLEEEPYDDEINLPPTPILNKEIDQLQLSKQPLKFKRKIDKRDMVILATIFGPPKTQSER
jgi:hypothetical protein